MSKTLKIIIVDDHEIFRSGLKMVLGKLDYVEVVGEASNGKEFLKLLRTIECDIVLMDIEMPVMTGVEATRIALTEKPGLKVISLTMFTDDDYVQSMIDLGVKGFLVKNIDKETLHKAITAVAGGGNYYSEELFNFFTRKLNSREDKNNSEDIQFTAREKEILQLLAEGLSNKEIAETLYISERTVVGHKSNMLAKTGCKSAIGLLAYALRKKLIII
ncbi:MAG: response regulator transcription factor [Bacteroidales bacterium]|nr:response regulator transcription factor [Bacteroidales bacterium]